jgi:class 3 adenylate cyclase
VFRVLVDRGRCIGAAACIHIAPTAFDWKEGEYSKADVVDPTSVEEELVREAMLACPTQAILIEEVEELLPWQLRGRTPDARRVVKTFMFTDIVRSTNLLEAMGDEAWQDLLRWHDEALRALFAAHHGEELNATGDGFFVGFDSPDAALACAVAVQRRLAEQRRQHGFAPQVRVGVHAGGGTQLGTTVVGKGVNEAARIASLAEGGEILASKETVAGSRHQAGAPREVSLKGISEPVEVVSVVWR